MKKNLRASVAAVFLAIGMLVVGVGGGVVHAASGGLTISPTSFDPRIAPGESYSGEIMVINQGDLDLTYTAYVTPYTVDGEDYKPYFSPVKGAVDITKWFKLGSTGGPLKIGEQNTIPFTVTVPKGTGAGSYYATVFAETSDKGTSGVVTRKRVGSVVFLEVTGQASRKGAVELWAVPSLQDGPLSARLKLSNSGSVYYQSDIKVTVKDIFGGTKFVYTRKARIIPQRTRTVPITWEHGASFGFFKVSGQVSIFDKTQQLPTHYVFVANTLMRIVTVAMVVAFMVAVIFVGKKRVAKK